MSSFGPPVLLYYRAEVFYNRFSLKIIYLQFAYLKDSASLMRNVRSGKCQRKKNNVPLIITSAVNALRTIFKLTTCACQITVKEK